MKTFVYTITEARRGSPPPRTAHVYRIIRGRAVLVGAHTETYASDWQLVVLALRKHKVLPARVLASHEATGSVPHCTEIEATGLARFTHV